MPILKFINNREREIEKLAKQVFADYRREIQKITIPKPNASTIKTTKPK